MERQKTENRAEQKIADASRSGATELDLSGNQLTALPESLGQLTQLQSLDLSRNQLTALPESLGQLTQLQKLCLYDNQLATLPESLGQLTQLRRLGLSRNQLTAVPKWIGNFTNLSNLGLSQNQLTALPESLGQLTQLEMLFLYNNRLTALPESLWKLKSLKRFFLHGNEKLGFPESVLGTPYEKWNHSDDTAPKPGPILDYYFRTRRKGERRPLLEAKLILVGRGEAGKTSLVRRLTENKFSRCEDRTQGIRITQLPVALGGKESARLHMWDFGGQEIMHATHQFFLTDRSVYLLVLDGRAGVQELEAEYWMRLISSFAPESPVLVVLNKIKKDPFELNRRALQGKFPQIRGFVETDCDNAAGKGKPPGKHGFGIEDLRQSIAKITDKLPDLRAAFPGSWFAIKEELSGEKKRGKKKNYLTPKEYRDICVEHGETNEESQDNLAVHLHRLGIALNYRDDPRLNDKHILNPHWVTRGIYSLLNSKRLAQQKGELALADLARELKANDYPSEMHRFLLDLMQKFELCFSFPKGDRYLIPELLDPQEPKETAAFRPEDCLNFHYRYPVLPHGLMPRYIVRSYVLSEKHRWRSGVILNFEGNRALVKADAQDRRIFIHITGPEDGRRRMLAMIRQDFEQIHKDISNLNPEGLVPLPSHPNVAVSFDELEVLEKDDKQALWQGVVSGKVLKIPVSQLLGGVELPAPPRKPGGREQPLRVVYSYSHLDARQRLKFSKHLAPLKRLKMITDWYDHEILPGTEWEPEIAKRFEEADMILLLVSADFVDSKYCYEKELKIAMTRHEKGEACVIPIIIRATHAWPKLPFGRLNALPDSGKAIPQWKPQDNGWANVAQGVERAVNGLRAAAPPKLR
jgi:internalin A